MFRTAAGLAFALMLSAAPAAAGPGADLLRQHLYAGTLAEGETVLGAAAQNGDEEAKAGLGVLRAAAAVEFLARGLHRHGFAVTSNNGLLPLLQIPVPPNPKPEPVTYAAFRDLFSGFVGRLDAAEAALAAAEGSTAKLEIDLARIGFDIDGDGKASAQETLGGLANTALPGSLPPELAAGAKSPITFAFDSADLIWLRGYVNVLALQGDFLLAHDFEEMFQAYGHRLFPASPLPLAAFSSGGSISGMFGDDTEIADFIALIHQIRWPVAEPERLAEVLARAKQVTALSRRNWDAIAAETDDDHEFLPGPKQTAWSAETKISDEMVRAWLTALDQVDLILDGKLLLPHWRFAKGFDLAKYFTSATRTDLVLLITGYDALPFLADGPVASADSFAEANRVFGDALWIFAVRAN